MKLCYRLIFHEDIIREYIAVFLYFSQRNTSIVIKTQISKVVDY